MAIPTHGGGLAFMLAGYGVTARAERHTRWPSVMEVAAFLGVLAALALLTVAWCAHA